MGIEWKIDGRPIAPGNLATELMKSMSADLERQLRREASALRCPTHGGSATLTFRDGGFTIDGCCDDFVQQVLRALT